MPYRRQWQRHDTARKEPHVRWHVIILKRSMKLDGVPEWHGAAQDKLLHSAHQGMGHIGFGEEAERAGIASCCC